MTKRRARGLRVDGDKKTDEQCEAIAHTCTEGLNVERWGDDEEDQVSVQACIACIKDLNSSRRDRRAADISSSANVLYCGTPKVSFHPLVRIRRIPPYSEVYGLHPRLFNFDKYGNLIMVGGSVNSIDRESVCAQAPGGGVRTHTPQTDMIDGGMRRGAMSRSAVADRDQAVQSGRRVQAKRASSRMARVRGSSIACHEDRPGPIIKLA